MSAQPSGTSTGTGKAKEERGGHLVMGTSHFPAPTLLPLGDALWGLGQFAYILIYKKLSAPADSDAWAAF